MRTIPQYKIYQYLFLQTNFYYIKYFTFLTTRLFEFELQYMCIVIIKSYSLFTEENDNIEETFSPNLRNNTEQLKF